MEHSAYCALVDKHRETILDTERHIWRHPETGFKEWKTSAYLADIFERAGYTLTRAGDIPGFYTDLDTGRPGPKLLILGELDALAAPSHTEAVDGCAHACGHNAQCAALAGVALALKEPGALDGLCGSIRLMAVPAEELIEIAYRDSLRRQGVIRYLGGKPEFLWRGYLDGVDLAFMIHTTVSSDTVFSCRAGSNGCMTKEAVYTGVAAHAGGSPHLGVNALYAASLGLQAVNALRETFQDGDHVRVHPILTAGGASVNIIPAEAKLSTFVRGATMEVIRETNEKVNRALAAGALALGAGVTVSDRPGYAPLVNDPGMMAVAKDCMTALVGAEKVDFNGSWGCGSTDMGDLSCIMPVIHPYVSGASGIGHGDDYRITDPETACVLSAKAQVLMAAELLRGDAARARAVLAGFRPRYASKEDYFAAVDAFMTDRSLIAYGDGLANIQF